MGTKEIRSDYHVDRTRRFVIGDERFEGDLQRDDTGENFALSIRHFDKVDQEFRGKITELIEYFSRIRKGQPVHVLDIAGGFDSLPSRELAERFGNQVEVTSIDLAETDIPVLPNFRHIRGDVFRLGAYIPDDSIDLAYSHQFLSYLKPNSGSHDLVFQRREPILDSLLRALKPDGVGLLEEDSGAFECEQARQYGRRTITALRRFGNGSSVFSFYRKPVRSELLAIL